MIFSLLVVAGLLVSGCCGCCISPDPDAPNDPGSTYSSPKTEPTIDPDLVGGWVDSSGGSSADLVTAGGYVVGSSAITGGGYRFNDDGTYVYRIAGSTLLSKGVAEHRGKYRVSGDTLYLYDSVENWYPFPGDDTPAFKNKAIVDESFDYYFEDDGQTLVLTSSSGYEERYHWVA